MKQFFTFSKSLSRIFNEFPIYLDSKLPAQFYAFLLIALFLGVVASIALTLVVCTCSTKSFRLEVCTLNLWKKKFLGNLRSNGNEGLRFFRLGVDQHMTWKYPFLPHAKLDISEHMGTFIDTPYDRKWSGKCENDVKLALVNNSRGKHWSSIILYQVTINQSRKLLLISYGHGIWPNFKSNYSI